MMSLSDHQGIAQSFTIHKPLGLDKRPPRTNSLPYSIRNRTFDDYRNITVTARKRIDQRPIGDNRQPFPILENKFSYLMVRAVLADGCTERVADNNIGLLRIAGDFIVPKC